MSSLWTQALARYQVSRQLLTRARRVGFEVRTSGNSLVVRTSTYRERRISEAEFERAVPLLDRAGRADVQSVTFNSSYVEAIRDDLRGA